MLTNPYRFALRTVAVLLLGFGAALLLAGLVQDSNPYGSGGSLLVGFGAAVLGLGVVALLLWLVVAALTFYPQREP